MAHTMYAKCIQALAHVHVRVKGCIDAHVCNYEHVGMSVCMHACIRASVLVCMWLPGSAAAAHLPYKERHLGDELVVTVYTSYASKAKTC